MKPFSHVWSVPIVLGVISAMGLLSALVGDSFWDVLSWIALAIPLLAGTYFLNKHLRTANNSSKDAK